MTLTASSTVRTIRKNKLVLVTSAAYGVGIAITALSHSLWLTAPELVILRIAWIGIIARNPRPVPEPGVEHPIAISLPQRRASTKANPVG